MQETRTRMSSVNRNGCRRGLGIVLRGVTCNVRTQKTGMACDKVQKRICKTYVLFMGHT